MRMKTDNPFHVLSKKIIIRMSDADEKIKTVKSGNNEPLFCMGSFLLEFVVKLI